MKNGNYRSWKEKFDINNQKVSKEIPRIALFFCCNFPGNYFEQKRYIDLVIKFNGKSDVCIFVMDFLSFLQFG